MQGLGDFLLLLIDAVFIRAFYIVGTFAIIKYLAAGRRCKRCSLCGSDKED